MARHNTALYLLIFSNALLLQILTSVCVASNDLLSPVTECVEEDAQYWWGEPFIRCDLQCPHHCICSLGNFSQVVVNCTSTNVSVVQIVYPPNITHLSWADNDLSGIGKDSFLGFNDLQELDLSNNRLIEICPGTFKELPNLKKLYLSHNMLQLNPPDIFSGLVNLSLLSLQNNMLTKIDPGAFQELANLTELQLDSNMLKQIQSETFRGLTNLRELSLWTNMLIDIQPRTFEGLEKLETLHLNNNMLKQIQPETFLELINLKELFLRNNSLTVIHPGAFAGLATLEWFYLDMSNNMLQLQHGMFQGLPYIWSLDLSNNGLTEIPTGIFEELMYLVQLELARNMLFTQIHAGIFRGLIYLDTLILSSSNISSIQVKTFAELSYLRHLMLDNNPLQSIHPDLFQNLMQLVTLSLFNTGLQFLPNGIFQNMPLLQLLNLSRNNLNELGRHPFIYCPQLFSLDLYQNPLQWIQSATFEGLNSKTRVLVDNFATCCFLRKGMCFPKESKSPFLSCGRMLPFNVLRFGIWIVSTFAIVANVMGILVRCKHRRQTDKVQFLIITNLSIADFLMGVYLIILLSVDLYYTDYFPSHSKFWRNSTLCKITGSLSVLSSEASVFFITLISIDRFICIKYPYKKYLCGKKSICMILSVLWIIALFISIATYLLSGADLDFYSASEICVGLPLSRVNFYERNQTSIRTGTGEFEHREASVPDLIHTGNRATMFFSIAIFTGLNLACFIIVGVCNTAIFISVRQSSKRAGHYAISNKEIRMAKKMFLLVLTDFCCWVPIGVLSILVQAGAVEVNARAYAWIAMFVLPINSALNPFLYTLGDVISDKKFTCKCCEHRIQVMPLEALNG